MMLSCRCVGREGCFVIEVMHLFSAKHKDWKAAKLNVSKMFKCFFMRQLRFRLQLKDTVCKI